MRISSRVETLSDASKVIEIGKILIYPSINAQRSLAII